MIRYAADQAALENAVDAVDATWRTRAATRTGQFLAAGKYSERSAIWSTVKPVFMNLQMNKCVFCERQFESELYGKIEFDLEHFRPKSSVTAWPKPHLHAYSYAFPTGGDNPAGYYWLPYELGNYAASCKVCNSGLKSNYFPIADTRRTTPGDLATEKAFLCYPIGSGDVDPETLITFVGTTAVPKAQSGHKRRRAEVIIDFFHLNKREQLHRERANMIILLGQSLAAVENGFGDETDKALIDSIVSPVFPHTACIRAFKRLWRSDRQFAKQVFKACKAYYASGQGTPPPMV